MCYVFFVKHQGVWSYDCHCHNDKEFTKLYRDLRHEFDNPNVRFVVSDQVNLSSFEGLAKHFNKPYLVVSKFRSITGFAS